MTLSHLRTHSLLLVIPLLLTFLIQVSAEEKNKDKKDIALGEVSNLYGIVLGSVDEQGKVYNRFGKILGFVSKDGVILNISQMEIGKVNNKGEVYNQSGTRLGTFDSQGNVFSNSGRKIGSVNTPDNPILIGGAARLLLLGRK